MLVVIYPLSLLFSNPDQPRPCPGPNPNKKGGPEGQKVAQKRRFCGGNPQDGEKERKLNRIIKADGKKRDLVDIPMWMLSCCLASSYHPAANVQFESPQGRISQPTLCTAVLVLFS
jgi:hypothetical protein